MNSRSRYSSTFLLIHYSILDEIELNRSVLHRLCFPIYYNSLWTVYQILYSDWLIEKENNSTLSWHISIDQSVCRYVINRSTSKRKWKCNRCTTLRFINCFRSMYYSKWVYEHILSGVGDSIKTLRKLRKMIRKIIQ